MSAATDKDSCDLEDLVEALVVLVVDCNAKSAAIGDFDRTSCSLVALEPSSRMVVSMLLEADCALYPETNRKADYSGDDDLSLALGGCSCDSASMMHRNPWSRKASAEMTLVPSPALMVPLRTYPSVKTN